MPVSTRQYFEQLQYFDINIRKSSTQTFCILA
jgi:hypothetical protein